jgi:hypothetical protein
VIASEPAAGKDGAFSARLAREVRIDEPGWLALRIDAKLLNEFNHKLFAHTSPVYVDVAGKRAFDVEAALALQRQVEEGREAIRTSGKFSTPAARDAILALYDEAAKDIRDRINRRGK